MSASGFAQNLGIERSAAQATWRSTSSAIPAWPRTWSARATRRASSGYVETVFGRRLWLPDIASANQQRRQGAERQAINAPMQGTAADLVKLAMIAVQAGSRRRCSPPSS
jgi:DNA polymerase-1